MRVDSYEEAKIEEVTPSPLMLIVHGETISDAPSYGCISYGCIVDRSHKPKEKPSDMRWRS
jgi:hypothetical protein